MKFLLGLVRTLVALGMGVWIGGLAFFGIITAAIMFRMTKAAGVPGIAPQMVGPMLTRFGWICTVCSVILVLGWLVDGLLTQRSLWWRAQGAFILIAVAFGAYLNFGLLPTIVRDQEAAIPLYVRSLQPNPTFSPAETQIRTRFDAGHQRYKELSTVNLWLLVGALACLMARSLPTDLGQNKPKNSSNEEPAHSPALTTL